MFWQQPPASATAAPKAEAAAAAAIIEELVEFEALKQRSYSAMAIIAALLIIGLIIDHHMPAIIIASASQTRS